MMKSKYLFFTAFSGLRTNKSRSALTILGIVIGVCAIILIMSLGQGAEGIIVNEVSGFGGNVIEVHPGKEPKGPTDIANFLLLDSLKNREVEALQKKGNVPDAERVSPAVLVPGSVSYRGETFRPMIIGGSMEFFAEMMNLQPDKGTFFDDADVRNRVSVAVIGSKVKEELFGESDAIGNDIKIKDKSFRVVATLPPRGQSVFFNMNELVVIPHTTAQTYLMGIDYYQEIDILVGDRNAVARTIQDAERTLRELHNISDPADDDFYVVSQEGMIEQIRTILSVFTIFLSAVVAISLIVGGIGVMNIMLVSVTERTREIGLRKALGGTNRDILWQFLLEAVLLTVTGGAIGIAIGASLAFVSSIALSSVLGIAWSFSFPYVAAALGIIVSAGVGIVFGLYPALQAAKKSPLEALRYE